MRLCQTEWDCLKEISLHERINRNQLISFIEQNKVPEMGLTSAIRFFTLNYYRKLAVKHLAAKSQNKNLSRYIYDIFHH